MSLKLCRSHFTFSTKTQWQMIQKREKQAEIKRAVKGLYRIPTSKKKKTKTQNTDIKWHM